jgi:hypothetical protein
MSNPNPSESPAIVNAFSEWFLHSAAALLLALALLIGWYNIANGSLVPPPEPLSGLSLRTILWIAGGVGLAVTVMCLTVRSYFLRLLLVALVAVMFEAYQGGLFFLGSHALHACFASFSAIYGVPLPLLEILAQGVFLYFLIGGLFLMLQFRSGPRESAKPIASSRTLKMACPACGGHIQFAAQNIGQIMPCPHCQKVLTLRKPDNLKMCCFFCQEHIEFPPHAIGEKMPCPHCKKDITLMEPM